MFGAGKKRSGEGADAGGVEWDYRGGRVGGGGKQLGEGVGEAGYRTYEQGLE